MAFSFLLRLALAGRNSYWLDELYSVYQYTLQPDSLRGAIRSLADTSIHPPLYQASLYVWVALFGDTETATRTLSNVYVTLGVVFTYLACRRVYGTAVANVAALVLALAFGTMLFGLETRSYGQTLMLAAACWLAAVWWLSPGVKNGPRVPWRGAFFFAANLSLLLTHYYNFFLWAAQIAFVAVYLLATRRGARRPGVVQVASNYAGQLAAFLLIWGRITYDSYQRNRGAYEVDVPEVSPLRILNALTDHVWWFRAVPTTAISVTIVVLLGVHLLRRLREDDRPEALLGSGYLLATCVGAPVIAYLSFLVIQAERFNARYFLYLVPLIAVAGVVAGRELVRLLLDRLEMTRAHDIRAHLRRYATFYGLVVVTLVIMPGTLDATAREKDDWRGGAQQIGGIIASDPEHRYVVVETSWRSNPMLNYYLRREADREVDGVILRSEERRGEFRFEEDPEFFADADRLIVPFIHHATVHFPEALERLDARYERRHTHIVNSRGLIVYDLTREGRPSIDNED